MDVSAVTSATDEDIENVIVPYVRGNYNENGLSILNIRANNGGRLLGLVSQNGLDYGMCLMFSWYWVDQVKLYRFFSGTWGVATIK